MSFDKESSNFGETTEKTVYIRAVIAIDFETFDICELIDVVSLGEVEYITHGSI